MATNYVLDPVLVQEIVDAKNELKKQADKSIPLVNTLETYVNQISSDMSGVSGVSGVSSFKGRTGAVEPTQDDYSYNQLRNLPTIPQTTNQLSDVTLSNPEDKQALIWSETLQQWVNKTIDYNDLVNKPATDLTGITGLLGSGLLKRDSFGVWSFDTNTYLTSTANAASASKLNTARTLAYTGDVTGTNSFNGTANISTALTLANSGVIAGIYKSVTVDAKGRVTAGTNPTTLLGYGITDAAPSTHVGATGTAHGVATTSVNGFMSAADKTKLDGIGGASLSQTSGSMTPTVKGAFTAGTWTPSVNNIVEWVKTGKVVNFNIVVSGTLTGADGPISVNLPTPFGALTVFQDQIDIPCHGWTGFTTEVKGLVNAKAIWNGTNNVFWFYTQANTTPWAESPLLAPAGVFSLNLTCSVLLA